MRACPIRERDRGGIRQYETLLCEAGAIGLVGVHSTVPAMQVSRRRLIRLGSAGASARPLSVAVTVMDQFRFNVQWT